MRVSAFLATFVLLEFSTTSAVPRAEVASQPKIVSSTKALSPSKVPSTSKVPPPSSSASKSPSKTSTKIPLSSKLASTSLLKGPSKSPTKAPSLPASTSKLPTKGPSKQPSISKKPSTSSSNPLAKASSSSKVSSISPAKSPAASPIPSEAFPKGSSSKLPSASKVSSSKLPRVSTAGKDATSCPSQPLISATWKSAGVDAFLANVSLTVPVTQSNNIQSLAASFGAPNFFCGLDNFCNAGQPCLPVTLPAWYALVAIQNWNSYMNAMNTALGFAATMVSLTLPGIVNDFYAKPDDNITPLVDIGRVFTAVLGLVPFTGPFKTAASALSDGLGFVDGIVKPPAQPNMFLQWSNVATSMSTVLQSYQGAMATAVKTALNTPVNATNGINALLKGGNFLGTSQNFTESDIQAAFINSTQVLAISLALQAQKVFIEVNHFVSQTCDAPGSGGLGSSETCVNNSDGSCTSYLMTQSDSHENANNLDTMTDLLTNKYAISQQEYLINPVSCYLANNKTQLTDPFNGAIPLDSTSQCLFNVLICYQEGNYDAATNGIVASCRSQGVPI